MTEPHEPQNEKTTEDNHEQTYREEPSAKESSTKESQSRYDRRREKYEEREAARQARYEYRMERRGSDGIGVGLTFIFIGLVWMMAKLGYINFSILGAAFDLWPLIFVVIGVNILFRRIPYIGVVTWLGFLTAILAYGFYFHPTHSWVSNQIFGDNDVQVAHMGTLSNNISFKDNPSVKEGNLALNFATGNLTMGDSKDQLIDYVVPKDIVNIKTNINGSSANFAFNENENMGLNRVTRGSVDYNIYLSKEILWFMDIAMGAGDCALNFSEVPVRELSINGGAGDFDIKLSNLQDRATVNLNMAAGDAKVEVPKEVGLRVEVSGIISDNNFESQGLIKKGNYYETEGYSTASKTIAVNINSMTSDIRIERH